MTRQLRTVRQAIGNAADSQRPTERVRMGILIADYPGTGEIAHVQLTDPDQGSATIVRARVLGGLSTGVMPARTPVSIVVRHGQPVLVGFGGGVTSANITQVIEDNGGGSGGGTALSIWEKFMDTVGFVWTALPDGWSTFFASPNTGTSEYLEFTAAPIDTWHYAVTTPYATMLLNAVTVMETKFYIPAGETTQVGIVVLGGFYTGWLVYIDSTSGIVYVYDEIQNALNTNDGVGFSYLPANINTGVWYTLRVMRAGNVFTAYINGKIIGTIAINAPGGTRFEELNGTIDGANDTFTTAAWWTDENGNSVRVYRNGLLQNMNTDYTLTYLTREIVFTTPPLIGDALFAVYEGRLGGNNAVMPLVIPGVWARGGTARFKDIVGWRLALP